MASTSVIYGMGSVLQRAVSVLLLPMLSFALSPRELGLASLVTLVSIAFAGLFSLGVANSLPIYYFAEADPAERPKVVWTAVALVGLCSTILVASMSLAAPALSWFIFETPEYANLLRIALLALGLSTVTDPLLSYLRMQERAGVYVALTLLGTLVYGGLALWFVFSLDLRVTGLIVATLLSAVVTLVLVLAVVMPTLPLGLKLSVFVPLARVGIPPAIGVLAFFVIDYSDRQFIQRLLSLDHVGIYSIGYSFGMAMLALVGAFAAAWIPFSMSFTNRRSDAAVVFATTLRYYAIGFGLLSVAFFAVAKPVIETIVAPEFASASAVVGLVATAYMLKGCYLIILPPIHFEKKLHLQAIVEWSGAILNVVLNLALIPVLGIAGAALATMLSYAFLAISAWLVARRYLHIPYDWPRIGLIAVIVSAASILLLTTASVQSKAEGLVATTLIFLATALSLALFGLSAPERRRLTRAIGVRPMLRPLRVDKPRA